MFSLYMINWPDAFYYDNKPSRINGREVNSHRFYFTINLCGTGATPGSANRQVSALGYFTDCATWPVGIYRTYTVFMSIAFVFCGHKGP